MANAPRRCRHPVAALAALLGAVVATAEAPSTANAIAQRHLRLDWYRIEVVLFSRADASGEVIGAARPRLLASIRWPRLTTPLIERDTANGAAPIGPHPPLKTAPAPFFVSNLPPPRWFGGDCAVAAWTRGAPDPCLWRPAEGRPAEAADLEAYFGDGWGADWRIPELPADEVAATVQDAGTEALPNAVDFDAELRERARVAFADYERSLIDGSHEWRRSTPRFAVPLRRLRQRYAILAAGGWHQPLPPRDKPSPVLMQMGTDDAAQRFVLEGWMSVTLGRYVHLDVELRYRLPNGDVAVLAQHRRMRRDEPHYVDHPAFGMLVYASPLTLPTRLAELLDAESAHAEQSQAAP